MHVVRVLPESLRWRVTYDRSVRLIDVLATKERAIERAREVAEAYGKALVVVLARDGSIEETFVVPASAQARPTFEDLAIPTRFSVDSWT